MEQVIIQKELSQIAENWTEAEYRARPELSYSTLSTYEKLGYNGIDHLFDRVESPSLTFGSAVDAIMTGGMDEFNAHFIVRDINITDSGISICKELAAMPQPYATFHEIPERTVSEVAKRVGFWQNDKWDKIRYREVLKTGDLGDYYHSLLNSDKAIINTETYQNVVACVRALRESPATSGYFADNSELSPIRRYYQLKFKAVLDKVGYRCMSDLLCVDYENKRVFPIDLKTSMSCVEWDFEQNFKKWHYYIQARLYWRIIRANMDADDYFKDFSLEDYRFIIINPKTLTPLVWEFPLTKSIGSLVTDDGYEVKDPCVLGSELRAYLDCKPPVPNGIIKDGINTIKCLKKL